jgi:hypothetical protein
MDVGITMAAGNMVEHAINFFGSKKFRGELQ